MHIYKELKIWQKSRNLVKEIYLITEKFPKSEKYGLISQIQRASVSIPSNIAEGAGRGSDKDFIRFLEIAYSSSYELDTQIILANDLNYIKDEECQSISISLNEIQKMIYNLISKLKDKIDK
jgi:four helix bundle protein